MAVDSKLRILVVDDEDDLRNILSDVLEKTGYEIKSASNGEEAINLLKKNRFDLTLLDIQMPNLNGIEVLKYIKQHFPATKSIMLTGYADLKHAMEAKEFGAVDFISKPYQLEEILSTIDRALKE
ncbi:MAG: response regulator [Ignavibacteria bacterium]|nr:response regulator [Ignavibacteria bacterium]MBI3766780.1 response regulator [Ignavibacteriales bacterium]